MQKKIIIAATSACAFAKAAHASGYAVIALDAFMDEDLMRVSTEAYQVNMHDGCVDSEDFKRQFAKIDVQGVQGFCYGSMFDAAPDLLDWIAARVPVIGNTAETLKLAKAFSFFDLLDTLEIPHPEVRMQKPQDAKKWLAKTVGGSGGMHVRAANGVEVADYFQQKIEGEPVSMLFLADGEAMQVLGFNRQFVAPTAALPYRFAGAVSGVKLAEPAVNTFRLAAAQLTRALGLRGVNCLDAIWTGEKLYMLELNPRLSASFDLYPQMWDAHIEASQGRLCKIPEFKGSRAKMTLFADQEFEVNADIVWDIWVTDIPNKIKNSAIAIAKDAPICTVNAEAETAEGAYAQVEQYAKELKGRLYETIK